MREKETDGRTQAEMGGRGEGEEGTRAREGEFIAPARLHARKFDKDEV